MDDDFGFDDSFDTGGGLEDIDFDSSDLGGGLDDIDFDSSDLDGGLDNIDFDSSDLDSGLDDIDFDSSDIDSDLDELDFDCSDIDSGLDELDFDDSDIDNISNLDNIEIEEIQNDDSQIDSESDELGESLDFDTENEGYFENIPNEVEPFIMEEEQSENISETTDTPPETAEGDKSPQDAMRDYMYEHNYGQMDYPEYSQDPGWQALNEQYTASLENTPQTEEVTPDTSADFPEDISSAELDLPDGSLTEAGDLPAVETNEPQELQDGDVIELHENETDNTDLESDITDITPETEQGDKSPQDAMRDYMYEHNYGQMDYPEYSQDPGWQALNEQYTESLENTPQNEEISPEPIAEFENDSSQIETEDVLPVTEETNEVTEDIPPLTEETVEVTEVIPLATEDTNEVTEDIPPATEETNEITEDIPLATEETNEVTEDIQPVTEETNEVTEDIPPISEETNVVTEDVQPVTEETNDVTDGATNELSGEAPVDLTSVEDLSEKEIDEVFESWDEERLSEGFENIEIAENQELLDNTLNNFVESNWEKLSLDEQKESMSSLAEYVTDVVGFENPPIIEYYNNEVDGDYGGYDSETNTLCINEHMLYDSNEAADTIAHELWHAHQHECAENPQSVRDYQYQYNFENYISPEMDFDSYQDQLLESEARAFAAQFKDRLEQLKGR